MTVIYIICIVGLVFAYFFQKQKFQRDIDFEKRERELMAEAANVQEAYIADLKEQHAEKEDKLQRLGEDIVQLKEQLVEIKVRYQELEKSSNEKLELFKHAEKSLADTFNSLSANALKSNNESFLNLAKTSLESFHEKAKGDLEKRQRVIGETLEPLKDSLKQVNEKIQLLEEKRSGAYASLVEQIQSLQATQAKLHSETHNLSEALQSPNVRGQWGEMQLKRSVELAGMLNYVDFLEQVSVSSETKSYRPDMLIHLPNERKIIVDAKTPLSGYLSALNAKDINVKNQELKTFANKIREHLTALGSKQYWNQFEFSPEFVLLFLPGESFFSAALQADPELIEFGVKRQVLITTPTTLIALLKAISYGWKQEAVAKEAQNLSRLGKDLYERMAIFSSHFDDVRKSLGKAVVSYNKSVSSIESRVLPTARRFRDLYTDSPKEINELTLIDATPVITRAEELSLATSESTFDR